MNLFRFHKSRTIFLVFAFTLVVNFYIYFSHRTDDNHSSTHLDISLHHHRGSLKRITLRDENKGKNQYQLNAFKNSTTVNNCACYGHLKNKSIAILEGKWPDQPRYLTIGIPTVKRASADYLFKTLTSLINNLNGKDQKMVNIIVFLADFDPLYKLKRVQELKKTYQPWLESGLVQIIQAPRWYYPKLRNLKRNYNDSPDRVFWRSKQCIDYAFLFEYSATLSQYYMQLEDDVVTFHGYFDIIRDYIHRQRHKNWSSIHFSTLGYIGKLYRSSDIVELGRFFYMFYDEHPVDYLINFYSNLKMLPSNLVYLPSLFQHIGIKSSLKGKSQPLKDIQFALARVYDSNNPPAKVTTTLQSYGGTEPEFAYGKTVTYYWCKQPRAKDTITIIFHSPIKLKRVAVLTGDKARRRDCLHTAELQVSSTYYLQQCISWNKIGDFKRNGNVDIDVANLNQSPFKNPIRCVRIYIPNKYRNWVILREIAIWSEAVE